MKQFFKKHRRLCLNTAVVVSVILLLGLNILFPYLMQVSGDYLDATPEGLYTLTDKMKETCEKLTGDVTITFCDDPDRLLSHYETRYPYVMAVQLAKLYDNIHVETVNLSLNPTAVNRFKVTSATEISPDDVIFSCGGRYRIQAATSFWTKTSSEQEDYFSFNGEFKFATLLLSITSIEEPVVCFAYGHGEHIYVPEDDTAHAHLAHLSDPDRRAFYTLMKNQGLKVDYVNLDTEDIPEDCVLLVMDGPTVDYTITNPSSISEVNAIKKVHAFLSRPETGSWMLFKDPTVHLPTLEDLSEDWGIRYANDTYIRGTTENTLTDETLQKLIVELNQDDSESLSPYYIYDDLLNIGAPPRMIAENTGSVSMSWINPGSGSSGLTSVTGYYYDFMYAGENAYPYNPVTQESGEVGTYALAALSMREFLDTDEATNVYSYVFGGATTSLTSNTYLEDPAYSNYDVMFATVRFISRVDVYASMELGGLSWNSTSYAGKQLLSETIPTTGYEKEDGDLYHILTRNTAVIWVVVLVAIPALAAGTTATVLLIRRKNR